MREAWGDEILLLLLGKREDAERPHLHGDHRPSERLHLPLESLAPNLPGAVRNSDPFCLVILFSLPTWSWGMGDSIKAFWTGFCL